MCSDFVNVINSSKDPPNIAEPISWNLDLVSGFKRMMLNFLFNLSSTFRGVFIDFESACPRMRPI